jgi:hypoxanthine phosphoribosyltransferase
VYNTQMTNQKNPSSEPVWETWDSALLKSMTLGADIQTAVHAGKIPRITKVACIPRGGLYVVNILARQFGISGDNVLMISMSRFDRENNTKSGAFKIGQMPSKSDVEGQVILLAEEIFDTCETVEKAVEMLMDLGANKVITAALHYKPLKNKYKEFKPDFYVSATDGWVHYPWEVIDPIGTLHQRSVDKN